MKHGTTKNYMRPRKYLSELKLHEAKVLIQQAHLSLTDIAERLGYSHLSHFSRQFKRWTGISPMEYRKQVAVNSLVENLEL